MRDLLPDEADDLLKGRVQVINLWRPIKGPLQDSPLAVCDATTIEPGDLVPSDLVYAHRVGETYPSAEVVRRFHDMGGRAVTVGSDAHLATTSAGPSPTATGTRRTAGSRR